MKIIRVDAYGRDNISDRLVAENIQSRYEADVMLQALKEWPDRPDNAWYRLEIDNYKLFVWEP